MVRTGIIRLRTFLSKRSKNAIRIVLYHRVSTSDKHSFEKHIHFFRTRFRILSLSEAVELIRSRADGYGQCLVVTFDDGFKDNIDIAVPILRKHNVPACFFIISDFISTSPENHVKLADYKTRVFHFNESPTNMTWEDLRQLSNWGFEIGSHTHTHPRLSELSEKDVFEEMEKSKNKIEAEIGLSVKHFAWPWGKSQDIPYIYRDFARKLAYASCSSGIRGLCDSGSDVFNLPRHGLKPNWPLFLVRFFIE